ncbi:hypothetical protein YC2023_020200 [Brassica napus]
MLASIHEKFKIGSALKILISKLRSSAPLYMYVNEQAEVPASHANLYSLLLHNQISFFSYTGHGRLCEVDVREMKWVSNTCWRSRARANK